MTISQDRLFTILLAAVIVYLLYKDCSGDPGANSSVEKETTVTETVDIKKTIDEAVNNALARQTPETRPYIIYPDNRVVPVLNINDVSKEDLDKVKNLNTYKDTTKLKNATVYSEIVADGKVYSNKITAEVEEKTITKTVTEKTTIHGSGLFVKGGGYFSPELGNTQVLFGLEYIRKNDMGFGAGVLYDVATKEPYYGVTVSKKIF